MAFDSFFFLNFHNYKFLYKSGSLSHNSFISFMVPSLVHYSNSFLGFFKLLKMMF